MKSRDFQTEQKRNLIGWVGSGEQLDLRHFQGGSRDFCGGGLGLLVVYLLSQSHQMLESIKR